MSRTEAEGAVRVHVARRLGVQLERVKPWHSLGHDLGMHPLDVVMVTLDLEDSEHVTLPLELLESVTSVGELAWLLQLGCDADLEAGDNHAH